jgi:choline dehydrogenase-like flavoprotein
LKRAEFLPIAGNPRTDWCWRTEPEARLGGRSIPYARGRVLGGCSSINAMIYMRGQARDFDEWAALTDDDAWGWEQVLPWFKRSEDHWRGGDTSRGSVAITSACAADAPLIAPCYLSTPQDRKVAADALRLTRHIASMPALAPYHPAEYVPGANYQSDEELANAAGAVGTTIFHPVGTCKMGRADDPNAVVDPSLRLRGIGRLRVIDASIMPTITSGNTNAPTVMIAEKGAEYMRAERRRT